jgi:hypothetical protein
MAGAMSVVNSKAPANAFSSNRRCLEVPDTGIAPGDIPRCLVKSSALLQCRL